MKSTLFLLLFIPIAVFSQKIFLIGDAGEPKNPDQTLALLSEKTQNASSQDVLIFLGDNIYPKGLPDKEHPDRSEMEKKLIPQLEVIKSFPGRSIMLHGNHDWAQGRPYGWQNALNMQAFIKDYLGQDSVFLPNGGCPGPLEIPLNERAVIVVLNTQYFLHPWDKPDEDENCPNSSTIEALDHLKSVIQKHKGKHILLAAHHPVFTYGEHHGIFSFKDHLKPIPILGSLEPLFRRFIGNIQDNTHPKYKAIMKQILNTMDEAHHVIHAAGHEHSLQLIETGGHHFIVSGSGSKTTFVKKRQFSQFARSENGFAILELAPSGMARVEYWGKNNGKIFEKTLYKKELRPLPGGRSNIDYTDSTIRVSASQRYRASKAKQWWFGKNYREVWSTPVEVEVIDLDSAKGGLEIVKKGGGMQTKSLRLEARDGKQYVLRSIEKYPEDAIPAGLRETFAQDIVRDQISASHPYGAFIIPTLAEAAGLYHTNPKPVFIPDDPKLGQYRTTFAGTLALFEERPANEDNSREPFFGGGEDIDGTDTVLENLREDNDNSVDQNFVVRNRLFDMWIGDWDRHDDQWRWAQIDKEKGNRYRPIPRDRDQVFFLNEGVIPKLASRKWALPKIEGFDEDVRWAPGISQNARFFDRSFMNEPDWEDWKREVQFLQETLTDSLIRKAIHQWPDPIEKLTGERIKKTLIARRESMRNYARELYLFLAKEVEVLGSDKHEYFLVEQLSEEKTRVTVRKRKKDGELKQVIYQRVFRADETQEVRLYGLDGEDVFEIRAPVTSKIMFRIIGGTGKDLIINGQEDDKLRKIKIYDRYQDTQVQGNSRGILKLSKKPSINSYNRKAYKYDILMPLVTGAINRDDGIFLGGGFSYTKHGWRKEPFAQKHKFTAKTAFATGSFHMNYESSFTNVIGSWGISPSLLWQNPFFVNNFFGLGNETEFFMDRFTPPDEEPIDYYRIRINRLEANVRFVQNLGALAKFYIGPGFKRIKVKENENRILSDIPLPDNALQINRYAQLTTGIAFDSRNSEVLPTSGMTAQAELKYLQALTTSSQSTTQLSAEWAFYLSAKLPARLVIANRLGGAHNSKNFDFFNANKLGGRSNLRGFRRTRFYGRSSFYHNLDLRLKLFSFRSYIFPGQVGILAFHDTGRVWLDGENSDTWHTGKGVGLWVSPLKSLVLNFNYAFGEDENLPTFSLGFQF